ncbi:MAG: NAD-dependent succinate-semialdehyde dehydrogenase [Woeseiaceae bacterium]
MLTDGWIDGAAIKSDTHFAVRNPATRETIATVADLGAPHAADAVAAAQQALAGWRSTPLQQRIEIVVNWAQLIEANADELGRIVCLESGKPIEQAKGEAMQCAALLRWFAEQAPRLEDATPPADATAQHNYTIRQPVGVVAIITPWNFPAAAVAVKTGAAIVTGCTTVVKPSEETPLIALALASLASEAGLPNGVINVVPCQDPSAVGQVLCQSEDVRMLSFTGSIKIGQQLYAACGSTVKRVALELGGNAPFVVFDDADIDKALDGALGARFYNSGQICVGANRYYIHTSIYDDFAARFAERVSAMQAGDGFDESSDVGPLINRAAVDRLNKLIDNACAAGAEVLAGGRQNDNETLFYAPTVLGKMTPTMAARDAEIFGPVACLYAFDDEDDVLQQANDTEAGLSAYVYTKNRDRLLRFARAMEAGVIGANSANIFANDLPFGGIKQSGIGREHGADCLDEYTEVKSICLGSS